MDIPHTITWRSVVLQTISKPEINRPKLAKHLNRPNIFKSIMTYTEENIGRREALRCHMQIVKGLTSLADYKRKQIRMIQGFG